MSSRTTPHKPIVGEDRRIVAVASLQTPPCPAGYNISYMICCMVDSRDGGTTYGGGAHKLRWKRRQPGEGAQDAQRDWETLHAVRNYVDDF